MTIVPLATFFFYLFTIIARCCWLGMLGCHRVRSQNYSEQCRTGPRHRESIQSITNPRARPS